MRNFFNGWRRTFGIGTLLTLLVFTGAWVKSYVDFGLNGNRANSLTVPGFMSFTGYNNPVEWPGHLPEINWTVTGFYSQTIIGIAPEQVVKQKPSNPNQKIAMVPFVVNCPPPSSKLEFSPTGDVSVMAAVYTEEPDEREDELIQASAHTPSFVSNPLQNSQMQDSRIGIDFVISDQCSISNADEDQKMVESKLQFYGFRYLHGLTDDGSWEYAIQIPHWMVVLPLGLLSVVMLFGSGRMTSRNGTVVSATPMTSSVQGVERNIGLAGLFSGWRRKLGTVTLLASLALAGGWVRSRIVSDVLNFEFEHGKQLLLVSGKDGLVCQHNRAPRDDGSGTRYRIVTGDRHETMTFVPRVESEIEFANVDANILECASMNPPNGTAAEIDDVVASSKIPEMFVTKDDLHPVLQQPHFLPLMIQPSTALSPPADQIPLRIGVEFNEDLESGAGMHDWVGTSLQWGRFYFSHGPMETHFVIPYGHVVIPLTLLSALLLFSRRNVKPVAFVAGN